MSLPLNILLVEDNPADARLTEVALAKTDVNHDLTHAASGTACMDYLISALDNPDLPYPDLVLLDLNMPGKSGRDVLREIKNHPELRTIPVIILTSSEAERDVIDCYRAQANFFMTKPASYDDSRDMLKVLTVFLSRYVVLPGRYRH
ncbi:MAG: response regulator [Pseudomonadota bacterium]